MRVFNRLPLVIALALAVLTTALAACAQAPAPAAPAPAAPAAPTTAPKAAAPTTAPAAAPTTAPAAAPKATDAPKAAAPAPAGSAKPLVIGNAHDLKTLDPGHAYETVAGQIHRATYDTLVQLGASDLSKFEPSLAEKWDVSADGLTYTFTLRKGVKFHSGNELTANDVKFSWERTKNLKDQPSFLFDFVKSIEAKDATTLVVTLSQPDPAFLGKMAYGATAVVDSKTVMAQGGVSGADAKDKDGAQKWLDANSAGTGPFILKSWTKDSEVVLERNPNYWRGPAKVERVIFKNIPQTAAAKLALEAGDIDIALGLTGDQAKALEGNAKLDVVRGTTTSTFFLLANRDPSVSPKGVMANPLIAQAMRFALDYDGIRALAGGSAKSPVTIVAYGFFGSLDESKAPKRDLAKAKQLLKDAGYPDGFDIELDYPTKFSVAGVDFDIMAQKIQADLAEAGIRAKLKPGELQVSLQAYRDGKQALGMWLWNVDYFEIQNYIEFMPERKVGLRAMWNNANADAESKQLRDQALVETDPTKRQKVWGDLQQYLADKGPFVAFLQPGAQVGVSKSVKGYVWNPFYQISVYALSKE